MLQRTQHSLPVISISIILLLEIFHYLETGRLSVTVSLLVLLVTRVNGYKVKDG